MVISVCVPGRLEEAVLEKPLLMTKTGSLGVGRVGDSLSSMVMTFDMVGLSLGSSCTHNSPTFTHLINCSSLQLSCNVWSIKSNTLFAVQSLHACENVKRIKKRDKQRK